MTPFPGMDPYLEHPGYWRDFHHSFITYWSDWLLDNLPDHYHARIDVRNGVLEDEVEVKAVLPDLSERPSSEKVVAMRDGEPVTLDLAFSEGAAESYIRVTHRPDASLIAVLELLSPTNKYGAGRPLYLEKRNRLIAESVHLVELDLLLGGARLPIKGTLPPAHYYAYVSRGDQRPRCEVYHWKLDEPLTRIRLPLKPPDPDILFDLPAVFQQTYQRGRYTRSLPYSSPPPVELPETNSTWISERLRLWQQARQ